MRDPPILEVTVSVCSSTNYDMDTGYGKQGLSRQCYGVSRSK